MPKHCTKNSSILTSCTSISSSCPCDECKGVSDTTSACQCPDCQKCSLSRTCDDTSCTTTCKSSTCQSSTSCATNTTCQSSTTCDSTTTCQSSTACDSSTTCQSSTTCDSSSSCESSISSTEGSTCSESEEEILGKKKFDITFEHKCGHLYADHINGNKAIYVNGKVAPILKLRRGYVYYFNVKQKCCDGNYDNSFVLTQNPIGKIGCVEPKPLCNSFDPVTHGCVKYHVTCKTPKYFYYQSANAAHMGGLILVESDV
jgi:hypothetical protein